MTSRRRAKEMKLVRLDIQNPTKNQDLLVESFAGFSPIKRGVEVATHS
jgi:hypothetical protein